MTNPLRRPTLLSLLLCGLLTLTSAMAAAETRQPSGDGSGIGGTGNNPGGSGMGGTGTREQKLPDTLPDLPETPDTAEIPDISVPDAPEGVTPGDAGVDLPDTETPAAH